MARTAAARRQAPVTSEEPEGLTFGAMKAAAEIYWPGLGGKVCDQWREWNRDLFDGALRPVPLVLSRMSSVHGHFFPLLDIATSQRMGYEGQLVMQIRGYQPPQRISRVRRTDLLRGMMDRLHTQDGRTPLRHGSPEWCGLIMDLHRRITGERIWCAPEREEIEPAVQLGEGLYRPASKRLVQDPDPETGAPSLPRNKISSWPVGSIDLGHIERD